MGECVYHVPWVKKNYTCVKWTRQDNTMHTYDYTHKYTIFSEHDTFWDISGVPSRCVLVKPFHRVFEPLHNGCVPTYPVQRVPIAGRSADTWIRARFQCCVSEDRTNSWVFRDVLRSYERRDTWRRRCTDPKEMLPSFSVSCYWPERSPDASHRTRRYVPWDRW